MLRSWEERGVNDGGGTGGGGVDGDRGHGRGVRDYSIILTIGFE
jgi:hypothetical protein